MGKTKIINRVEKIAKLLPDILVYHYFDWAFTTENEELPSNFNFSDTPYEIKNIIWYDDLHDNIMSKVSGVIKSLYFPKEKIEEIESLTIAGLGLAYLMIPPWEEWEELAEEMGVEVEDLDYYQKWQEAKKFSELSHISSFLSSEAIKKVDNLFFDLVKQEIITKKNKAKKKKGRGFKS